MTPVVKAEVGRFSWKRLLFAWLHANVLPGGNTVPLKDTAAPHERKGCNFFRDPIRIQTAFLFRKEDTHIPIYPF